MSKNKTLLVVDDSDVDRTILKTILSEEFNIIEKSSGFAAVNFLTSLKDGPNAPDAILLDVSMPAVNGFDVLQFMKEAGISNIPVFLITAEATRSNVERATQYGVAEFIRKPFDKRYIIKRIKLQLGIISEHSLTETDLMYTYRYIEELERLYKRYLNNFSGDIKHYQRISDLMKLLLTAFTASSKKRKLDKTRIELISKAGFFCDIGNMVIPPASVQISGAVNGHRDLYQYHTLMGAEFINLNHSRHCRYFIDICTDICMHHHERYDGKGFPHKIVGDHNLIYSQMCRLADQFDQMFYQYQAHSETQFMFVLSELERDAGNVSKEMLSNLADCKSEIIQYYSIG